MALYEALYGERPFAGDTLFALADEVTAERIKTPTKGIDIPAWLRRWLLRGLRARPEDRFDNLQLALRALSADPAAKRRRLLAVASASLVAALILLTIAQATRRKRVAIERQQAAQLAQAEAAQTDADQLRDKESGLRDAAVRAYNQGRLDQGDAAAVAASDLGERINERLQAAAQALDAALLLEPRGDIRSKLVQVIVSLAERADRRGNASERNAYLLRLAQYDTDKTIAQAFNRSAQLSIRTFPAGALVEVEVFQPDNHGRLVARRKTDLDSRAPVSLALPAGSYRLTFVAPGRAKVLYPILLGRGEVRPIEVRLPPASDVPDAFVYVPEGRFLFGDRDESLRLTFLNAPALHETSTGAYLIARRETTYAEWLEFLLDTPPAERRSHTPHATAELQGGLAVHNVDDQWELSIQPTKHRYHARWNEAIHYQQRTTRDRQDWRRFPVAGVSVSDMRAYLAWLANRRGLRGARLCTEREWERAARGADDRPFPHGARLAPDDANFDATYGRKPLAFGPDTVGSHPQSASPFGVDDLAGNVMEMTQSAFQSEEFVLRGGSYFYNNTSQRSTNREPVDSSTRTAHIGLRVCMDARS